MVGCQAGADRLSDKGTCAKGEDTREQVALASPKISRAKALVRFSRYRAAQEAAPGRKLDLNRLKQRVGLVPRFVSDMG